MDPALWPIVRAGLFAGLVAGLPDEIAETVRGADCTAFAFMHGLLGEQIDGSLRRSVLRRPNLVAYEKRMRQRLFAESRIALRRAAPYLYIQVRSSGDEGCHKPP